MKVAVPVFESRDGLKIAPHFGKAKKFCIFDLESGDSTLIDVPEAEKGRGRIVAEILSRENVRLVICRSIGDGAREKLKEVGIEVRVTDKSNPEEAVEEVRS